MPVDKFSDESVFKLFERNYFLEHMPEGIDFTVWLEKTTPFVQDIMEFIYYILKERQYSHCTAESYLRDLNYFVSVLLSEFRDLKGWSDVEDQHVHSILRRIRSVNDADKLPSARTKARLVSSLKSFYKFEAAVKKITNNFMLNVNTPKYRAHLPQYLSYEQFEKLVALPENPSSKDIRDRAMIELLFSTGIRISELVNIKLDDINFYDFEIRIFGKGGKERIVPFGSYALKAINLWLTKRHEYSPEVDNLFVNRFGKVLNTRAVQIMMKKLGEELCLPIHATPHKLRHSFATEMITNGADLRTVQEILGHSSLGVTQVYLHLDTHKLQENYDKAHPLAKSREDE